MDRPLIRILIAGDYPVVRSGLHRYIEQEFGLEICGEATNGHDAVRLAIQLRPNIVLLDINPHDLHGVDTLQLMGRDCPEAAVIIFSMQEGEELIGDLILAGARGYVLKTDPPEILISAIRALSLGRSFFSPSLADTNLQTCLQLVQSGARAVAKCDILTPRELQVLQQLADGIGNKEVAVTLGISIKTVETHRATIMRKLGARSVVDMVRYAIRNNLSHL